MYPTVPDGYNVQGEEEEEEEEKEEKEEKGERDTERLRMIPK